MNYSPTVKTVVITAGGLGTRLFSFTKVVPKAMLPIYDKCSSKDGEPIIRPLVEHIFDNLFDIGFRRFCFITTEMSKDLFMKHFFTSKSYLDILKERNTKEDRRFFNLNLKQDKKIAKSEIKWATQKTPAGFGDALLSSKKFVGNEPFLLHAADAYFPNYEFIKEFVNEYKNEKATCSLLVQKKDKVKGYGIATFQNKTKKIINVEEKPQKPKSKYAILPVYLFKPKIFNALKKTQLGHNRELQLTDGIMTLINNNNSVIGYKYTKKWFDIGTPKNFHDAVKHSYEISTQKRINKSINY